MKIYKNKFISTTLSVCALSFFILATNTSAFANTLHNNISDASQVYIDDTIDNLSEISLCDIADLADIVATTEGQEITIIPDEMAVFTGENDQLQFLAPKDVNISSPVDGTVVESNIYAGSLGLIVIIEDYNSNRYLLSHLGSVECENGDSIKSGDIIGTTGITGNVSQSMVGLSICKSYN